MKLVFSRKGFDSQYGGMPSPILPDGRLLSLPIPSLRDRFTFADVAAHGIDLAALLADLSGGRHALPDRIHLDPDLDRARALRAKGWRPALGQAGAAQGHLAKCGVGAGDVFLFFGWFRQVERRDGRWRYARNAPDLHVLFGWLEVDAVVSLAAGREDCLRRFPWSADHPHVVSPERYDDPRNTLYIGARKSRLRPGAGGGCFTHFRDCLQLTAPGASRSRWSLPAWFMPRRGRPALTYHQNPARWRRSGDRVLLQSVAKGQEFVLDAQAYPETLGWLAEVISKSRA